MHTRERNKAAFHEVVKSGPPPGLIAFDGNVGWCEVTPRNALPWLDRVWRLKRVDDLPVWSISCLYVGKGYRRRGITSVLITAAVKAAKAAGAPALEAYPLDAGSIGDPVRFFEHSGAGDCFESLKQMYIQSDAVVMNVVTGVSGGRHRELSAALPIGHWRAIVGSQQYLPT